MLMGAMLRGFFLLLFLSTGESSKQTSTFRGRANGLLTDIPLSRIKVAAERFVIPGDYVVNEQYGVGLYLGVRMVSINPSSPKSGQVPVVVVKYKDAEVTWFQKFVEKELWVYRTAESGTQEINSILDIKKWTRRKKKAEETSRGMASNLMSLMAVRSGLHRTPSLPGDVRYDEFERNFQWSPTEDQLTCFEAIENDMVYSTKPMDRLICGDVGFGKTEVACRAIYRAVMSKKQVALLAPTRILARQHERTLKARMPDVNIQLLRGGGKGDAKQVKEDLKNGVVEVVVGTHALLQPTVVFDNLGLLVIDEEQRFGVTHKEKLKSVAFGTDVLTLSATPIPRTLQMSLSGLRDFSQMQSPPKGRKEVMVSVGEENKATIREAIQKEAERGGQAFVVVPLIKDIVPAEEMLAKLLPDIKCITAHGEHADLQERVDSFSLNRDATVLIATTVIENGVDMPNVNTIIVLNANRFGMSALYQLRGRVGRSTRQAYAYFMVKPQISITTEAEARLIYVQTFTALGSGYDLACRDMEMRGAGSLFGSDQSGARDIGTDLQASILAQELQRIKSCLVLPVGECRLRLGELSDAELFGQRNICYPSLTSAKIDLMSSGSDNDNGELISAGSSTLPTTVTTPKSEVSEVSRWEAALARSVVDACLAGTSDAQGAISFEVSYEGTPALEAVEGKKKKKKTKKSGPSDISLDSLSKQSSAQLSQSSVPALDTLVRLFLSCSSAESLLALMQKWQKTAIFGPADTLPSLLRSLFYRSRLRIASRRVGIAEIFYMGLSTSQSGDSSGSINRKSINNNNSDGNSDSTNIDGPAPLTDNKTGKSKKETNSKKSTGQFRSPAVSSTSSLDNLVPAPGIDVVSNTNTAFVLYTEELTREKWPLVDRYIPEVLRKYVKFQSGERFNKIHIQHGIALAFDDSVMEAWGDHSTVVGTGSSGNSVTGTDDRMYCPQRLVYALVCLIENIALGVDEELKTLTQDDEEDEDDEGGGEGDGNGTGKTKTKTKSKSNTTAKSAGRRRGRPKKDQASVVESLKVSYL